MGEMKIKLLLEAKPINKTPYKLAHKYNDIVRNEIDNMVRERIFYLVDQFEWESPMVVQPKKHDSRKLRVCVDFRYLSKETLIYPFPTPFSNEIIK